VVPGSILKSLGIKPFKKTRFILANGESIEREVGTAHFVYKGHEGGAPVIFGESNDKPLLGATTLEALELALNPLSRDLYPLQMTLMGDYSNWTSSKVRTGSRKGKRK
jgi:predicted aspartyl protease